MDQTKTAIIIGAGPAGLTAAFELATRSNYRPVILEQSEWIGGISRTAIHNGNRMDIGGHRFFSKCDRVMDWWLARMPLQGAPSGDYKHLGRVVPVSTQEGAPDPEREERVMLIRDRLSRILFLRKFFDYPITLSGRTLKNLGLARTIRIGFSYLRARLFPIRSERSLEDFFINRFGRELYKTFFRDYTEKVWGVPCDRIKPEWGAQRVKGLSITHAVLHAAKKLFGRSDDDRQKTTETSLIEMFYYPKLGPGQMWEAVAEEIQHKGGDLRLCMRVEGFEFRDGRIAAVTCRNSKTGEITKIEGDIFFSTMPIRDLIQGMGAEVPEDARRVADGLVYRDFLTVGLLVDRLKVTNETSIPTRNGLIPDNWIYIQESDVKLGRVQIFNNWSPYLVRNPDKVWMGLEYFCDEGDELWSKPDEEMIRFAISEMIRINMIDEQNVGDAVVLRVPKAYPAYFGTYDELQTIKFFTDNIPNLFLIGRNGMHRYNNQDHSMLAAMTAVDNLLAGVSDRTNIWSVNTEEDYHESKTSSS